MNIYGVLRHYAHFSAEKSTGAFFFQSTHLASPGTFVLYLNISLKHFCEEYA